ncbi:FAD:protein FMN transferase [Alsobacter sp. KACC 23698]|uniref:FAD:protein FMN transferase n=1 Tax=Alsobacter sp. KACC 23698 TaxID=3149229 RepID=A0AAU7JIT7_9HYPH
MNELPSRRRFIGISAAAAGLAVLPLGVKASPGQAGELVIWRGLALGAICSMQIHHTDRAQAERLIRSVELEVRRLERLFSLYDQTSALAQLNRTGFLEAPAPEFVELLTSAQEFSRRTGGAFDVTVQPLWTLYRDHFARDGADPAGPSPKSVREALARVGYEQLLVGPDRVSLRRGMAVTLNGIAQGFVTDKVVELLRNAGADHSLVDMGESRAIGDHPAGRPWDVAIADPNTPERAAALIPIVDRALATSGPYGFRFDVAGRFNHIFAPSTGGCAQNWASASVVAKNATAADAFSTACCLLTEAQIQDRAGAAGAELVLLIDNNGQAKRITV